MSPLQTEPYRAELLAYCYRMLGSVHDAQDLVQETYLRAWRAADSFQARASVRTYLFRIATNACLTELGRRSRRAMPSDVTGSDHEWLQPIPDALLAGDPAAQVETLTGVRLAFVAALQHLPPIRRAALLLRDVLGWPTSQTAHALGTTPAAVNSALRRARAQMAQAAPIIEEVTEPTEPARRELLDRYVTAFQDADLTGLVSLMRADIALEMPPQPQWYQGKAPVAGFLGKHVLSTPGQFRMVATAANGQPAFAAYHKDHDGLYRPHAVHVLTLDRAAIAHIAVFHDPTIHTLFLMD